VFFVFWRLGRPVQDGKRAARLINTLFGAKD